MPKGAEQVEVLAGAEVTVFSPLVAPERHRLKDALVTVGRAADCTIPIRDRYLSRRHAEIVAGPRGAWILKDCGSANGTYLNGVRVEADQTLHSGDRIRLGDTEIVFQMGTSTDRMLAVAESKVSPTISIPVREIEQVAAPTDKTFDRLRTLNALAMELIEDRPFNQLSGFILERVMEHIKPSRAALALLERDGRSFRQVEVRLADSSDSSELTISRTLLEELVEEKKALAFMDVSVDEKLSRAKSIIMQGIRSVLCAPLMIGDNVVGVLYVDFQFANRAISEDDVKLVAQIARFAATKLETTRLREDAIQKRIMDEELKTASLIQRRLLPQAPPSIAGYTFAGLNRPCRTVSGDYYDFVVRPDGRVYFVIADVSGKGVTAALPMAGMQAAFKIYTKSDPKPSDLVTQLNESLKETLPQSRFITMFAGRLDPATGQVEFTNAGHNPPIVVRCDRVEELSETDLLLGMFSRAEYKTQRLQIDPGDSLVLFTDGVTESENAEGVEFGMNRLPGYVAHLHGASALTVAHAVEDGVLEYIGDTGLDDDVTLVIVSRNP